MVERRLTEGPTHVTSCPTNPWTGRYTESYTKDIYSHLNLTLLEPYMLIL